MGLGHSVRTREGNCEGSGTEAEYNGYSDFASLQAVLSSTVMLKVFTILQSWSGIVQYCYRNYDFEQINCVHGTLRTLSF